MNDGRTSGGVHLSVVAGIFATFGSLFGKLAGGVPFASLVTSPTRGNSAMHERQAASLPINTSPASKPPVNLSVETSPDSHNKASSLLKLFLLVTMVTSNTVGCTLFVKSLQKNGSSLPATVASAATNYFCSALIGFLVFGESTSLMWWCGTSLVLLGLILICCTSSAKTSVTSSTKDKDL